MLEILIFIYQNYWNPSEIDEDAVETASDETLMAHELALAGFDQHAISQAFNWVRHLRAAQSQFPYLHDTQAIRLFCEAERDKLGEDCLNFLCLLHRSHMITAFERDLIIDCALALPQETLTMEELRWVAMMVMCDEPRKQDFLFVEDALLHPDSLTLQ